MLVKEEKGPGLLWFERTHIHQGSWLAAGRYPSCPKWKWWRDHFHNQRRSEQRKRIRQHHTPLSPGNTGCRMKTMWCFFFQTWIRYHCGSMRAYQDYSPVSCSARVFNTSMSYTCISGQNNLLIWNKMQIPLIHSLRCRILSIHSGESLCNGGVWLTDLRTKETFSVFLPHHTG